MVCARRSSRQYEFVSRRQYRHGRLSPNRERRAVHGGGQHEMTALKPRPGSEERVAFFEIVAARPDMTAKLRRLQKFLRCRGKPSYFPE